MLGSFPAPGGKQRPAAVPAAKRQGIAEYLQVFISHLRYAPMQQLKWQDGLVLANFFQPCLEKVCSVRPSMDGQASDRASVAKKGHTLQLLV